MAETVNSFPKRSSRPAGSRWDRYLDGRIWKLTTGNPRADYCGTAQALQTTLGILANRRKWQIRVQRNGAEVYVQLVSKTPQAEGRES